MRRPLAATAICAEPSTCPAGWKVTRAVECHRLAVPDRLRLLGEIVAVAQPHEIERRLRRQHGAVAGAGVVGMAVGDERPLDWPGRIDMEGTELAAQAGRRRQQDVFGTHGAEI